jgi:hypothetical protein
MENVTKHTDLETQLALAIADVVEVYFKDQFDPADPSMDAAGGRAAWNQQAEEAVGALELSLHDSSVMKNLVKTVLQFEEMLHNGEFYDE